MKKWILSILGVIVFAALAFAAYLWYTDTPKPEGVQGPKAEAMTDLMFDAINKEAWDTLRYIRWTFPGDRNYVWDKKDHQVTVSWDDTKVYLNTKTQKGKVFHDEELIEDLGQKLAQDAWSKFCNDSWWLNPMVKARDAGTTRSIVTLEDGREGLMIEYASGGVTPGDAYVYILDKNGLPSSYLMWVQIIPVGGVEFSFSEWKTLVGGSKIVQSYSSKMDLKLTDIKAGNALGDLGLEEDYFEKGR